MAHTVSPQLGSWAGIPLTIVQIVDEPAHDWVAHEYPGRDGAEFESMGKRAFACRVEAIFFGPTWWDDAFRFLLQARSFDPVTMTSTFVHPWWGAFDGVLLDPQITHEDRRHTTARISFRFREGEAASFAFATSTTLSSAVAAAEAASATAQAALAALP